MSKWLKRSFCTQSQKNKGGKKCFYDLSTLLGLEVALVQSPIQNSDHVETRQNNVLPFEFFVPLNDVVFLYGHNPCRSASLRAVMGLLSSTQQCNLYADALSHPLSARFISVCLLNWICVKLS